MLVVIKIMNVMVIVCLLLNKLLRTVTVQVKALILNSHLCGQRSSSWLSSELNTVYAISSSTNEGHEGASTVCSCTVYT